MPSENISQPVNPPAPAAPKNTPIGNDVFRNLLFPLTQEILKDFLSNTPGGEQKKQILSNHIDQRKDTDTDHMAFDAAYFKPKEVNYTEFTLDPAFRKLFRESFIETYRRKRNLSGIYSADLLYAPDEKGNFSSETSKRILYLSYEIVQTIQDKKIKNLITEGKTTGTDAQLINGNLLLFLNKKTGEMVALTEEQAKKPENMDLIPYLPLDLRDKATGQNMPTADPIGRAFDLKRATSAERLLEEQGVIVGLLQAQGLIISEPFTVDANGEIKGKVMAAGKDNKLGGPILNVRVRSNLQSYIQEKDQNQLRFDFNFENKNNIDPNCPNEFFLYTGDLKMFKDPATGAPRPADEVAKKALEHNGRPLEYEPVHPVLEGQKADFSKQGPGIEAAIEQGGVPGIAISVPGRERPKLESLVNPTRLIARTVEHIGGPRPTTSIETGGRAPAVSAENTGDDDDGESVQAPQPQTTRDLKRQQAESGQPGPGSRPGAPNRHVEEQQPVPGKKGLSGGWKTVGGVTAGGAGIGGALSLAIPCTGDQAKCATFLADKVADVLNLCQHVISKFHF